MAAACDVIYVAVVVMKINQTPREIRLIESKRKA